MTWTDIIIGMIGILTLLFAFVGVIYLGFQMGRQSVGQAPATILPENKPEPKKPTQPKPTEDPYVRAMRDPRKTDKRIKTLPEEEK